MDLAYLNRMGLGDRRNKWRESCGLAANPDEDTPEEGVRRLKLKSVQARRM
jgi:hypothetical protein